MSLPGISSLPPRLLEGGSLNQIDSSPSTPPVWHFRTPLLLLYQLAFSQLIFFSRLVFLTFAAEINRKPEDVRRYSALCACFALTCNIYTLFTTLLEAYIFCSSTENAVTNGKCTWDGEEKRGGGVIMLLHVCHECLRIERQFAYNSSSRYLVDARRCLIFPTADVNTRKERRNSQLLPHVVLLQARTISRSVNVSRSWGIPMTDGELRPLAASKASRNASVLCTV